RIDSPVRIILFHMHAVDCRVHSLHRTLREIRRGFTPDFRSAKLFTRFAWRASEESPDGDQNAQETPTSGTTGAVSPALLRRTITFPVRSTVRLRFTLAPTAPLNRSSEDLSILVSGNVRPSASADVIGITRVAWNRRCPIKSPASVSRRVAARSSPAV